MPIERPSPDRPYFKRRQPRVPVIEVIGRKTADVVDLYRADGFQVEVVERGNRTATTADLRANRIRLIVSDGRIVRASVS